MTSAEVRNLLRAQGLEEAKVTNGHGIALNDALVPPQRISIIQRTVQKGRLKDKLLSVWLVGQKRLAELSDLREDGPLLLGVSPTA